MERPASWFDSRMPWNVLEWMIEPWIIIHHCTSKKIIYESNLSWLNTIILSEKICIRNNGYNFWARNFIGKIIDPLCQLFSIWLWNQAWFDGLERLPRNVGSPSDHGPNCGPASRDRYKPVQERYNWSKVTVFLIKILCWLFIQSFWII